MSGLKLVSVRHGRHHKSLVLYSSMPRDEAERLLSAAFGVPQGTALQLMDPVSKRRWSVVEACRDTVTLPDVVELVAHNAAPSAALPTWLSAAAAAAAAVAGYTQPAFTTESRPLLHHTHHSHRVQPYQPHNRQQSRTSHQLTQTMIDIQQQQQQQQQQQLSLSPQPTSPSSPSPASTGPSISFPPPFVLSLHSLTDLAQALQLSESLIVLLFIVSPAAASSTTLSRLYRPLATSALYRNLLFVSVESSLLASAASVAASTASTTPLLLPVTLPPPPALQLYYAGTCIGEVGNVNEEQLITIVQSSDELMQHIAVNGSIATDDSDNSGGQQQQAAVDSPTGRVQWEEGEEEEGVLLSADEAVALEKLVLREDSDVLQAYSAFPELSLVVDAFMRVAKHVGREKEARRRRAGETAATSSTSTSSTSATSALSAFSSQRQQAVAMPELDDLLSMTMSTLQQHGLLSRAEVDGVLQLYAASDSQVLQTLLAYQRDGREEQLMENLLRIAMAYKLGMTAQLAYSTPTDTVRTAATDGSIMAGSREWEGRDDSEGMRERRMAASVSGTGTSGTRSKWATQSQRRYKPIAFDNADDEEEDEREEEEEEGEEGEEQEEDEQEEEEDDNEDEQYEDDTATLNAALGRLGIATSVSASSAPTMAAPSSAVPAVSSRLYEDAISLLAALSFQQLISSEQLSLFVALLTQQHPLLLSALLAYQHTNDMDDLLNTLHKVYKRLGGQHSNNQQPQQQQQQQQHPSTAPRVIEMSGESAELAELLSRLPPSFLATHGTHLSSLIANRDAVLLSALQIWREQEANNTGRDREKQHKDMQQLLTIIMRRAEKERQRAETSNKSNQQPQPSAAATHKPLPSTLATPSVSSSHPLSTAQPQSPSSPQVTAEQVQQLKQAYSSGVQQQQQQQQHKQHSHTALPLHTARTTDRQTEAGSSVAQLERALSHLQSTGQLSVDDCSLLRSRLAAGDARILAVLQVAAADGDVEEGREELTDSLTRIAHTERTGRQGSSNTAQSDDSAATDNTQSANTQHTSSQASEAAATAIDSTAQAGTGSGHEAAVTVEDVTVEDVEADNSSDDIAQAPLPQAHREEERDRTTGGEDKNETKSAGSEG